MFFFMVDRSLFVRIAEAISRGVVTIHRSPAIHAEAEGLKRQRRELFFTAISIRHKKASSRFRIPVEMAVPSAVENPMNHSDIGIAERIIAE
jgi:hypothetical protein